MRFKKAVSSQVEIDMTPMIDIVFQLIAFFMVITNFEQTQADERVRLAKDQLAIPSERKRDKELIINIGFVRQGGEKVDPEPFIFWPGENLRINELEPKLRLESQIFRDEGTDIEDVTVVVRADAETPTGILQEVIKMAQKEGIEFQRFSIKAKQAAED